MAVIPFFPGVLSFLLLINLCGISAMAQSYQPMLGERSEWYVVNCFNGCLTDYYFASGDTVIEGRHYQFVDGYHFSRAALIREEVKSGKVFYKHLLETEVPEFLIYDFSLDSGDLFNVINPVAPAPKEPGIFEVDSIRYMVLNGSKRKVLYLTGPDTSQGDYNRAVWVEGVGSLSLLNTPGVAPSINGIGALSCFFLDGEQVYSSDFSDSFECETQFTGKLKIEVRKIEATVFAKKNNIRINFNSEVNGPTVQVLDLSGRSLFLRTYSGEVANLDIPMENERTVFLVKISVKDGVLVRKVFSGER